MQRKRRAGARDAHHGDAPAHQFGQAPGNPQPQARAAMVASCRAIDLPKFLKDRLEVTFRDPDPRVAAPRFRSPRRRREPH